MKNKKSGPRDKADFSIIVALAIRILEYERAHKAEKKESAEG